MRKHLCTNLWLFMLLVASSSSTLAQGIIPVRQPDGRVVFENAPSGQPAVTTAVESTPIIDPNPTGLVYWSRKDHRWKPVPPASKASMRAARNAAAEVRSLMAQRQASGAVPAQSSRYRALPTSAGLAASRQMEPTLGSATVESVIDSAAKRHNVDPNLVRAIVQVESNFNPRAVSNKGALGLMQLMPKTAKSLKVSNAFDPQQNVDAGVRHLKTLLNNFGGDIALSLAAYNAGETAVQHHRGVPPYAETRDYVKRITALYSKQNSMLGRPGHPIHIARDNSGHIVLTDLD
jgi:soluble lytic murein transglycosylase-like protein